MRMLIKGVAQVIVPGNEHFMTQEDFVIFLIKHIFVTVVKPPCRGDCIKLLRRNKKKCIYPQDLLPECDNKVHFLVARSSLPKTHKKNAVSTVVRRYDVGSTSIRRCFNMLLLSVFVVFFLLQQDTICLAPMVQESGKEFQLHLVQGATETRTDVNQLRQFQFYFQGYSLCSKD